VEAISLAQKASQVRFFWGGRGVSVSRLAELNEGGTVSNACKRKIKLCLVLPRRFSSPAAGVIGHLFRGCFGTSRAAAILMRLFGMSCAVRTTADVIFQHCLKWIQSYGV
jgi:hypothetical protein